MYSQQFLVCDNSTVANFKSWASAVSNFIRSAGWTNTTDTGQLNGAGAGNWTGVTTVPGSGAFYYEIFQPGDSLTPYYLKLEYGNSSGSTNSPTFRLSIGTSTNGTGGLTGFTIGTFVCAANSFTAPSATTTYECNFSADASGIGIMMWRTGINQCQQAWVVERSINSSGAYTSGYVTCWTIGNTGNSPATNCAQQSLVFGVGGGPLSNKSTINGGMVARGCTFGTAFNNQIAFDLAAPMVPYYDLTCTRIGIASSSDLVNAVTFSANVYGTSHTYFPTRDSVFAGSGPAQDNWCQWIWTLVMRMD